MTGDSQSRPKTTTAAQARWAVSTLRLPCCGCPRTTGSRSGCSTHRGRVAREPGAAGTRAGPAVRYVQDDGAAGPGRAGHRGAAGADPGPGHLRGQAQGGPDPRAGQLHRGDAGARPAPQDHDPGDRVRDRRRADGRPPARDRGRRAGAADAPAQAGRRRADVHRHLAPAGPAVPWAARANWTGIRRCTRRWDRVLRGAARGGRGDIETVLAGPEDARLLGVDVGLPLLLLSRHAFDSDGMPVEFAQSWYRGEQVQVRDQAAAQGQFVTVLIVSGTGTGVGKTVVTAAVRGPGPRAASSPASPWSTRPRPGCPPSGSPRPRVGPAARPMDPAARGDRHARAARFPDPLSPEAAARVAGLAPLDLAAAAD